jgi:hypothetical protein
MGLQDGRVGMAGIGVVGDVPPNALQPALPDGVHLRWAAAPDVAFPWWGYYLFRREHRPGKPVCFSNGLTNLTTGPLAGVQLSTAMGLVRSDRGLVLTDDFPPTGRVELDLTGRTFLELELDPAWFARRVEVKVGFRRGTGTDEPKRTCIDFRRRLESGENPRAVERTTFLVLDADGGRAARTTVKAWATKKGELRGLDCGSDLEVVLPCPAHEVDLLVSAFAKPIDCEGLDKRGRRVAHARTTGQGGPQVVRLRGAAIHRVRLRAEGNEAALHELCFVCEDGSAAHSPIVVTAYDDQALVASTTAAGQAGQVQTVVFELDRITRVKLSGGAAALVDVCVVPLGQDATRGWQALPNLTYPLTLPVEHPDYPAHQGAANLVADQALALGRVHYGPSGPWSGSRFGDLHAALAALVVGGPGSTPMAQRTASVPGTAVPPDTVATPTMPNQGPYGLVMLGSLNPAVAQMLGLYWVDDTADPAKTYDYLVVADSTGAGQLDPTVVLGLVTQGDWSQLDGHITYGLRKVASPPLGPPAGAKAYALPGTTVAQQGGGVLGWTNNAGLTWDVPVAGQGALLPGSAVLYHVWRAGLGDAAQPATPTGYSAITGDAPVLVVRPDPNDPPPQWPSDWPPFALQYIDTGLAEGWYGYELSGIDIFGRHSANAAAAPWHQWTPEPTPRPWYYVEPAADRVVHPSAVRLEDVVPPPPPTAMQAWALDPADPFLLHDGAYQTWFAAMSSAEQAEIGLRVRWQWTWANQRQAPDTREFRMYFNPGRFNALVGDVTAVTAAAAGVSQVTTDIANTHAADAYAGTFLQMGPRSFRVTGSDAGTPLVLRVQDTTNPTQPAPGTGPCSITIPPNHSLAVDTAEATSWDQRRYVVDYNAHVTVTTDADGHPLRTYEVLLPAPNDTDRTGVALAPSITDPIAYGAIGLTAVDDKTYVTDDAKWTGTPWGDRYGNESFVTGPAIVFCVFRGPVPAPVTPADSDAVYASSADYHSHSFYTYRWPPLAGVKLHVYRAMDDAVFAAWWAKSPRPTVAASDDDSFPKVADEPRWDQTLRATVAADIQQLASRTTADAARDYFHNQLSHDALRVLASLSDLSSAFSQITIQALDPAGPANADRPGPDTAAGYAPRSDLRAYVDTLDGRSTNRWFYRSAYVDGAHNLSPLSLAGPPVYLPDVVAPRTPVVTRALGGEREVTVTWAPNREPDLAEYRILRAPDAASAADARLMTLVHAEPVTSVAGQPADWSFTDTPVPPLTTLYYRLVAVDTTGNVSTPSAAVPARAYDESLPVVPALTATWSAAVAPADAQLAWTSSDETILERRADQDFLWQPIGEWRAPGTFADTDVADPAFTWFYRVRVRKDTGAQATGNAVQLAHL